MGFELTWICICDHCRHRWLPATIIAPGLPLPKHCARCKRRTWNQDAIPAGTVLEPEKLPTGTEIAPKVLPAETKEPRPLSMGPDCPECGTQSLWNKITHRFECPACGFLFKPLKRS